MNLSLRSPKPQTLSLPCHMLNILKVEFAAFNGNPSQYHKFMSIFKQTIEPAIPNRTLRLT